MSTSGSILTFWYICPAILFPTLFFYSFQRCPSWLTSNGFYRLCKINRIVIINFKSFLGPSLQASLKTVVAFTPTISSPTASSTPSITYCVCAARSVTVTVQRILPSDPFPCFQEDFWKFLPNWQRKLNKWEQSYNGASKKYIWIKFESDQTNRFLIWNQFTSMFISIPVFFGASKSVETISFIDSLYIRWIDKSSPHDWLRNGIN